MGLSGWAVFSSCADLDHCLSIRADLYWIIQRCYAALLGSPPPQKATLPSSEDLRYGCTHCSEVARPGGQCAGAVSPACAQYQTCAKVPKRFEILGSLSPRSGTLMDLGPCTSFLPWDSGNPGPQNCVMPQDPGNPGPQDFDMQ